MINFGNQNYTSFEMIRNIFSPLVSVITTPLVDEMVHKNNMSFVEMLQPFSILNTEGKLVKLYKKNVIVFKIAQKYRKSWKIYL